MLKKLLSCFLAYSLITTPLTAAGVPPASTTPVPQVGFIEPNALSTYFNSLIRSLNTVSNTIPKNPALQQVPVCSGGHFKGDGGLSTAANQTGFRRVYYCPDGASSISLIFAAPYRNGGAEIDLTTPVYYDLSIEASVYPPWSATMTYAIGAQVNLNQTQWTALAANTNSYPTTSNTNWAATSVGATGGIVPATCNGIRACGLPTTTLVATGATITQGYFVTDPVAVDVPVGGWIAVNGWTPATGNPTIPLGYPTRFDLGDYWSQAASQGDRVLTGGHPTVTAQTYADAPAAIIGSPKVAGPTACFIGDSRSTGVDGRGTSTVTIVSGGTGYVAADVGLVASSQGTGGSAGAMGAPQRVIIKTVAAGAVTAVDLYDTGAYTDTTRNPSQTLPTGTQNTTAATTGSGLTLGSPTFANGLEFGDSFGGRGFVQRGLNAAGVPWVGLSRSADTVANWMTRDYSSLALIAASGCSNVLIGLGINDSDTRTAAQIEADILILANQISGISTVRGIFFETLPPSTISTDGFATAGAQTSVSPGNSVSRAVNAYFRNNPAPFSGYFETSGAVETSLGSGIWVTNGTVGYTTIDGLHMTAGGAALASTAISNNAGILK